MYIPCLHGHRRHARETQTDADSLELKMSSGDSCGAAGDTRWAEPSRAPPHLTGWWVRMGDGTGGDMDPRPTRLVCLRSPHVVRRRMPPVECVPSGAPDIPSQRHRYIPTYDTDGWHRACERRLVGAHAARGHVGRMHSASRLGSSDLMSADAYLNVSRTLRRSAQIFHRSIQRECSKRTTIVGRACGQRTRQ